MMLRHLIDELMRRRLWPILALSALVAVATPLLFLKSAPSGAPVAAAPAPAPAPAGELPARAQRLLETGSGGEQGAARRPSGRAGDPFQPPSSSAARSSRKKAGARSAKKRRSARTNPIPVVITNADTTKPSTSKKAAGSKPPMTSKAPRVTSPGRPIGDATTTAKRARAVDVRFGKRHPGKLHRGIPRLQTFVAGGRVIAVFVKYSPSRDKAVFAIAPSTEVSDGPECRRKSDLCRYVDIPAGSHVRLTTLTADGSSVSRRLDVVQIRHTRDAGATAAAAGTAPANGACLLGRLLALTAHDGPLAADACRS